MTQHPAWQDPATIERLMDELEVWAVVGLSGDPRRTASTVAEELVKHGRRVVPIHPSRPTFQSQQGYASLAEVPFAIDVVDVFRRSDAAGEYVDQAIAIGARGVWFQLGVIDEAAFERAQAAGLDMVMDTCPAIEWHKRDRGSWTLADAHQR